MQLSSSGPPCWWLWPHSNPSIWFFFGFEASGWFSGWAQPQEKTAAPSLRSLLFQNSSARQERWEPENNIRGERRGQGGRGTESVRWEESPPQSHCPENCQAGNDPGIAAVRGVWSASRREDQVFDFPEVWEMHLRALQELIRDKCTHLLLPNPSQSWKQHHTLILSRTGPRSENVRKHLRSKTAFGHISFP